MTSAPRKSYRLRQVDVFTDRPYGGNPLAVILDADPLSTGQMQAIAREMNLSETSFVTSPTAPDADYRMRIFTPSRELPFAGHPSVGTAHVLFEEGVLKAGSTPAVFHQEVGIGVLPIEIRPQEPSPRIVMTQGTPEFDDALHGLERLSAALNVDKAAIEASGLQPQIVSTGLRQLMLPIAGLEAVQQIKPDLRALEELEKEMEFTGCSVFSLQTVSPDTTAHVRFFTPTSGISEDPATGSAAGALGAYLVRNGVLGDTRGRIELTVEQGGEIGRPSRIYVEVEHRGKSPTLVRVGGYSVTILRGELLV